MSEYPIYNLECPSCGSSDALVEYEEHTHCYSCSEHKFKDKGSQQRKTSKRKNTDMNLITGGEYRNLKGSDEFFGRGIDRDVCEKFGVKVTKDRHDNDMVIFPYYDPEARYTAQKYRKRNIPAKGAWAGDANSAKTFFGSQLWSNGKKLLVVEGEYDALAAFQIFGKKYPVVSLRNGADKTGKGPVREFKQNFDYFRDFEEVILCFDNDEPGKVSAEACCKVLPMGKCKIMNMRKHKDPNDYLRAGDHKDFVQEFWNARLLMPQDLVYGTELRDRIIQKLYDRRKRSQVRYPWENLNKLTYGIRLGEMVTVISGTGSGKSTVIGELMYHILTNTEEKMGMFMLEESVEMANLRLASLHAEKPYHLPDTEWTDEELASVFSDTIEQTDEEGNPRLLSFDHFGSNNIDELLYRVDSMVAHGCKYIFLDHVSIVVSDQRHGDERKALDEIITKLRSKAQEHDVALFVVSHLRRSNAKPHEEGGQTSLQDIRGTQAIAQLSDMVLGLERDGQAEDPIERNTVRIRVLKNRLAGLTGIGAQLYYDSDTGRLHEVEDEDGDGDQKYDSGTEQKEDNLNGRGVSDGVDSGFPVFLPSSGDGSVDFDFEKGDEIPEEMRS